MPTESRLLALAVLVAAVALIAHSPIDPWALELAVGTLIVAGVGLVSPTVPWVHVGAAVLGGAVLTATLVTSGSMGTTAILLAPIPVVSLRFGWRPAVWSMALSVVGVLVLDPSVLLGPLVVARGGSIAMFIAAWLMMFLVIGFHAADDPATPPSSQEPVHDSGRTTVSRPASANV